MNWLALIQRWLPIIVSLLSALFGAASQTQAVTLRQVAPAISADAGVKVPESTLPNSALLAYVVAALSAITGGVLNKPGGSKPLDDATRGLSEMVVRLIAQGQLDDSSVAALADIEAKKMEVLLAVAQHELTRRQSSPATIPGRQTT